MDALDGLRKDGFKLNYPCYSSLLMSLAELNLGFVAYIVYRRMVLDGFVLGAIDYRTIINALCKCGLVQAAEIENNHQEAFKVFEIMSREDGCRPNSVTFSTLIHGLCEVGRLEEAFSLKEEMLAGDSYRSNNFSSARDVLKDAVVDSVRSGIGDLVGKTKGSLDGLLESFPEVIEEVAEMISTIVTDLLKKYADALGYLTENA
ncbi:hypothetical protein Patl1_01528 [Pistacia atlantica]|uniref:Uncharacterized protein n=1 Tax=Pistacia atlantica TaxID=434234 RepID=A0ACC1C7B8_9ROSI|nr:hypothetical protein Patl1_01528 [Pistacia atlantica]